MVESGIETFNAKGYCFSTGTTQDRIADKSTKEIGVKISDVLSLPSPALILYDA